jgi:integrase
MPKITKRLTHLKAQAITTPGMHADGDGLYLRVDQAGGRSWVLIFFLHGRRREMGLGSISRPLADARRAAGEARSMVADGIDPIAARREVRRPVTSTTFEKVASGLLDELEKGWKSPKQRPQWEASLTQHAAKIWKADVSAVDTEMVLEALRPIWSTKRETAQRLRGRIERVLSAAKVQGHRSGENPARWDDHLSELLSREKQTKGHFAAMPYKDLPAFVSLLKTKSSASAKALLFTILAAGRSGEGRGAAWSEINGTVWVIPAQRMKAKEEHRVPLTPDMEDILNQTPRDLRTGLIFPGPTGAVLSDVSVTKVIRLAGISDATVHGFRSTFRDWAGDCTNFARETIEEALAHRVGDATEQAYRRSRSFEKRRLLMTAWADFCMGRAGQVVPFNARENG